MHEPGATGPDIVRLCSSARWSDGVSGSDGSGNHGAVLALYSYRSGQLGGHAGLGVGDQQFGQTTVSNVLVDSGGEVYRRGGDGSEGLGRKGEEWGGQQWARR